MPKVSLCPLYGLHDDGSALASLLRIDGSTILLDCGWDEKFAVETLEPLRAIAPTIDAVVLSHSDLAHLGGLPYAVRHLGLTAPIYGTLPIQKMGLMALFDAYQNKADRTDGFTLFTLDDIDEVFVGERFVPLKYSQRAILSKGNIGLTPYSAGRTLGGAVWRINEDIVYGVHVNHRKEMMLSGSTMHRIFEKPALFITDSRSAMQERVRDEDRRRQFTNLIGSTLRNGGNVLIPCDAASRSLEVLLFLNELWDKNQHQMSYPLVFLHSVAYRTIEFARSQLEWMSDDIVKEFDRQQINPFALKNVRFAHSFADVANIPQPMCLLCTSDTLDTGSALDWFLVWCVRGSELSNANNLLLLLKDPPSRTLAHDVLRKKQAADQSGQASCFVDIDTVFRVPYQGAELDAWREERRAELEVERQQREEEEQRKNAVLVRDMEDNDESAAHDEDSEMPESSSRKLDVDDDDETVDEVSKFRTHPRLFLPGNMRYQTAHLMFPCLPEDVVLGTQSLLLPKGPARAMNKGALEYGDPVNPNHFMASYAAQTEAAIRTEEMRRKEDEKRAEEEIEATLAALPAPHHLQQFKSTVEVICRVEVVDFSGKPDAAAVKNLVQAMAPRRIVFVDGTETETRQMADILRMGQPLIPSRGEWTDITVELHSLNVNLSERMMGSIHMHRTQEGIEIGFAEGRLAVEDGGRNEWIIEPASLGHNTVFVGDLKLADLRSVLVKAGFDAQFLPQSGALSCAGGNVFIRKTSGTTIAIESTLCKEYFAIRSLLYQQFVNV